MDKIIINTTPSYTVDISDGGIDGIGQEIKACFDCKKIMLITDSTVDKLYADDMVNQLVSAGFKTTKYVLKAGEQSKTLRNYFEIINALAVEEFTRKDAIVAFGGGVVGDISGFVASTYMRGIDYLQVPTTLLACVDSSVGGKTAVDLPQGKNLVGAFYQPKKVIIKTDLLKTLSKECMQDGMGEVLKYAVLKGGELLQELSKPNINLRKVIALCVDIKRQYVESDERDCGQRQMLNLGHTFGHAYEHLNNFEVSHGKSVALGLRYALEISRRLGIFKGDNTIDKMLDSHDVQPMTRSISELAKAMTLDKKNFNGNINFALIKDIGECVLYPMTISKLLSLSDKIDIKPYNSVGAVKVINSKSYCHRAIIMAIRAVSQTVISGVPNSSDILATINSAKALGAQVEWISADTIVVTPIKSPMQNAVVDVMESGSTMRFILPQIATLGVGAKVYSHGRLPERTNAPLIECLTLGGVKISDSANPIELSGKLKSGKYFIRGDVSSQYISGLLMALCALDQDSEIEITTKLESADYINITIDVMQMFGVKVTRQDNVYFIKGGQTICASNAIDIEGDWSNASPWLVIGAVCGGITLKGLNRNSKQGDKVMLDILRDMGAHISYDENLITLQKSELNAINVSAEHCPDLVPSIAMACAVAKGVSRISNVERLKIKESDRISSVIDSLKAVGIQAEYDGDIVIHGGQIASGTIDSHNDHRIAMLATIAGCISKRGVSLTGAKAIAKSYPNFYEELVTIGGQVDAW